MESDQPMLKRKPIPTIQIRHESSQILEMLLLAEYWLLFVQLLLLLEFRQTMESLYWQFLDRLIPDYCYVSCPSSDQLPLLIKAIQFHPKTRSPVLEL